MPQTVIDIEKADKLKCYCSVDALAWVKGMDLLLNVSRADIFDT